MGLGQRRTETGCFCNKGCPLGTMPFKQYWLISRAISGPDTAGAHWLMQFVLESPGLGCIWQPVETHGFPPKIASIQFQEIVAPAGQRGYRVTVAMSQLLLFSSWSKDFFSDIEDAELVQPEAESSCSRMQIVLPFAIPVSGFNAILTPAYPDGCVDADWPQKEQRKPLAAF